MIELKICHKQKGSLWVYATPILDVILVTLTENSSALTNGTQPRDIGNIQTTEISCSDTLPCATQH